MDSEVDGSPVRVDRVVDGVLLMTLDRPAKRNAVDGRTSRALAAALDALDADPTLAVGVLTGAGGTFCAGMDLRAFLDGDAPEVPGRGFGGLTQAPPAKPLIAAVEGYALAGGCELVLACDLVVAAEDATFGLPEVGLGLVAGSGGLLRLPHRVPRGVARLLAAADLPPDEAWARQQTELEAVKGTADAREGATAFAERRAPRWTGR